MDTRRPGNNGRGRERPGPLLTANETAIDAAAQHDLSTIHHEGPEKGEVGALVRLLKQERQQERPPQPAQTRAHKKER